MLDARILYVAYLREGANTVGYLNKIIGQCHAFVKEISHVYICVSRKNEAVLYRVAVDKLEQITTFPYSCFATYQEQGRNGKLRGYLRYISFIKFVSKVLQDFGIDVLYFRSSYPTTMFRRLLRKTASSKFVEIVTYPYKTEWKRIMPRFEYLFWKSGQEKVEKLSDIVVAISGEKDLHLSEKFILINNGIDLENIRVKKHTQRDYLSVVSIANLCMWHGYDRIIRGMSDYYKNGSVKKVIYNCVGDGPELENLKELTKSLGLDKYVIFHGTKTGEELDKIFDESDVALGSLGNHRKGLNSDSALKNREYCARGIPFVIASSDQDFPESFPYILKIPSDESPVDINEIVEWYEKLTHSHPNYSTEMRKYAEEHLSWDAKMKPVIEKIKEIAEEKGKSRS